MRLTDANKNIIAAIILSLGLIISSIIFAFSNRYEIVGGTEGRGIIRVDKWDCKGDDIVERK